MSTKSWALIIAVGLFFLGAVFVNAASRIVDIVCVGAIIGIFWLRDRYKTGKIKALMEADKARNQLSSDLQARLAMQERQIGLLQGKVTELPARETNFSAAPDNPTQPIPPSGRRIYEVSSKEPPPAPKPYVKQSGYFKFFGGP